MTHTGGNGKLKKVPFVMVPAAVFALCVAIPAADVMAAGPDDVVRSSHAKINQLLRQEAAGRGNKRQLDARMKKVVNRFLDFETLAKSALRRHWSKLTADQQREYVSLFKQLIESSYIRRLRGHLNYKVSYGAVKRTGQAARVPTVVEVVKRGRKSETKIVYVLHRSTGRWMVTDVVTNDVSLARNYRRSFGRIMRRDGFKGLIRKMKRKIRKLNR